jgi:hypothetical protein
MFRRNALPPSSGSKTKPIKPPPPSLFASYYLIAWLNLRSRWFCGVGWDRVHFVRRAINGLLYQPCMIHDCECGAVGGVRVGRGNRSTARKSAPVPLCPPQIPHDLTWARTRVAAVGSWRLIAWAMAWDRCRRWRQHISSKYPWTWQNIVTSNRNTPTI